MHDKNTARRLSAGTVEIAFEWAGDRWRHVVAVAGTPVLTSIEGPASPADDPRWPASPVLTEVAPVDAGGRPALLGLGLAGRSHFSASVAVHPALPNTLLFEVACRIQEPPAWLGSTYRSADGTAVRVGPEAGAPAAGPLPRTVQWTYAIGPDGLVPQPAAAQPRQP